MAQPILTYLTPEELETMHLAAMRLLKNTGVVFPNPEALELFHGGGADIDKESPWLRSRPPWWRMPSPGHPGVALLRPGSQARYSYHGLEKTMAHLFGSVRGHVYPGR